MTVLVPLILLPFRAWVVMLLVGWAHSIELSDCEAHQLDLPVEGSVVAQAYRGY